MNWWFEILIVALASARVTRFLVFESGPWNLLGRMRTLLGAQKQHARQTVKPGSVAELLNCPWCTSFWVTMTAYVLLFAVGDGILWVFLPLAASFLAGAAVVLTSR